MSAEVIVGIVALLLVLVLGGLFGYKYLFSKNSSGVYQHVQNRNQHVIAGWSGQLGGELFQSHGEMVFK